MWFFSVIGLRVKPIADVSIFFVNYAKSSLYRLQTNPAHNVQSFRRYDMSWRFFDSTADLEGQLNGNWQKGMLQIDTPRRNFCLRHCIHGAWAQASRQPNAISVGSSICAGLTVVSNRQTDRPRYMCSKSPHLPTPCMRCGLIMYPKVTVLHQY